MQAGQIVADKYRVESVLGHGGMGVVVSATHLVLDQPVAIKFLKPEACRNATAVARIMREARAVSRMETEHVARVLDCGVTDSAPFLVMELLHGRSLARELSLRGPLPVASVCDYLVQACDAVGEAHALGIVHRDLKPGNLFLARRRGGLSQIKVLDFGLSKVLTARTVLHEASLTDAHSLLGTPLYVSPEQLRSSKEVDARTDVWSLGLITYQLLTGYTPFYARSIPKLFAQIARDPIQPLRQLRPEIPIELEAIVERCLAKSPDDRFANAAELGLALAEISGAPLPALERLRSFAGRAIVRSLRPRGGADDAEDSDDRGLIDCVQVTLQEMPPRDGAAANDRTTVPNDPPAPSTTTTVIEALRPRRGWSWGVLLFATAAFALLAAYELFSPRLLGPGRTRSTADAQPVLLPPALAQVSLHVLATPDETRLFLDGHELGPTPFTGTLPRSGSEHRVRAEAPGFEAIDHVVTASQNVNLELHLRPLRPAPAASSAARRR